MTRTFNQSISEFEKENTRSSSVSNKNLSNYSRKTVNNIGKNNMLRPQNSNDVNYQNNSSINNNVVRSAMKQDINCNTLNISLNSNIRAARTSFNPYDNNERDSDISNDNSSPKDNYKRKTNKGASDYAISSLPIKPLVIPNYYTSIPNPTIKNSNSNNTIQNSESPPQTPIIQEVPRFINHQNKQFSLNTNFYQRGLNKSSSSPNLATLDKVNNNFYLQQGKTQYNFLQNQNQSFIQNQINNINLNLRYPYPVQQSKYMQNFQNTYNQTQNPYLNNKNNQLLNNFSQNIDLNSQQQIQSNTLTRHNSSRNPLISQAYIAQMRQQQQQIRQKILEQKLIQKKIQEQQKFLNLRAQELQKKQPMTKSKNQQELQEQKKKQMTQKSHQKNTNFMNNQIPIRKNFNQISQSYNSRYTEGNQLNKKGQQLDPVVQSQVFRNQKSPSINQQKQSFENSQNIENEIHPPLKQSFSQSILRKKPSFKNEITQQQIALAQMASLQNLQVLFLKLIRSCFKRIPMV